MVLLRTVVPYIDILYGYLQDKTEKRKDMDKEASAKQEASLRHSGLEEWQGEPTVLNHGALLYCRAGSAELHINFQPWQFGIGDATILFPGDVMQVTGADRQFRAEILEYDASLLREASIQLEHTVYSQLRADRCRGDSPVAGIVVGHIMDLLRVFFDTPGCTCTASMTLLQLKVFFLGFHDFILRNPDEAPRETESHRTVALFSTFMEMLAHNYRTRRDVAFYAGQMHISAKYLGTIVGRVTGHSCKTIIDHYVVMQLKTHLHNSRQNIKEIAWLYHFNDESFLCRYFKHHTGTTPQQYRKMI